MSVSESKACYQIHGALMALSFGVLLPCAAISHLSKAWIRIHSGLVSIASCLIATAVYFANKASGDMALDTFHGIVGWTVLAGILTQILLGISSQLIHNEDAKKENTTENIHGLLGKGVLLTGWINVVIGIQHLNSIWHDESTAIFYVIYFAWMLLLGVAISVMEVGKGRSTQYYSGNIFSAASKYGAKNLFSVPSSAQKRMIEKDLVASPRESKSPFLYRPSWDSGLKKATPIHKIAAFEEFMQREAPKDTAVASKGVLDRLKEMEVIPRSRSSSVTRENSSPLSGESAGRTRSSSVRSRTSNAGLRPAQIVTSFPGQIHTERRSTKEVSGRPSAIDRLTRQLDSDSSNSKGSIGSEGSFVVKENEEPPI